MQSQRLHRLDKAIGRGPGHSDEGGVGWDNDGVLQNPKSPVSANALSLFSHVTGARTVYPGSGTAGARTFFICPSPPLPFFSFFPPILSLLPTFKMSFGKLYGLPVRPFSPL